MQFTNEEKGYLFAVYILQALSFVTLITAPIGLILNYIKCPEYQDSFRASHCRWQKNTFWFGLLWSILGALTFFLLGWLVGFFLMFWLIYRIAKGWIYLVDGKEMYV